MERLREHLRVCRRLVADCTTFGHHAGEEIWFRAEVGNLGGGGLKLRMMRQVSDGETLKVAVHLHGHRLEGDRLVPGEESGLLTVLAQVVWVRNVGPGEVEAGVRFVGRMLDHPPGEEQAHDG